MRTIDTARPHPTSRRLARALALAATASAVGAALVAPSAFGQPERKAQPRPIVIIGGMLFDGSGAPPAHNAAILVADGRVKDVGLGASRHAPKDARRIDATGKWIMPGLADGHVHLFETGGLDARPDRVALPNAPPYRDVLDAIRRNPAAYLRSYVCAGVTSIADLGGPSWLFGVRDSRKDDGLSPRIAASGPMLSTIVPAELEVDGEPYWALKQDTIEANVKRLAGWNADLVAIEWRRTEGGDLEAETRLVKAAIDAAHRSKLRAAVRAESLELAKRAVEAGADVLSAGVRDRPVDDQFVGAVARRKVLYVSTLAVERNELAVSRRDVTFEPFERDCAPPTTIESFALLRTLPDGAIHLPPDRQAPAALAVAQANLKRIAEAGGSIVAGSGAGDIRTLHGTSLHLELALMAGAGLAPAQVLVAATRSAATLMGRGQEVGQVKAGMAADLVVLDADPLANIENTRKISTVIRGGTIYER